MLKPEQTQKIYAMAARLGLVEQGNKNDLLHELVFGKTQKISVRELTEQEYNAVVRDLADRLKIQNLDEPPKKSSYQRGKNGITEGQIKKVWQLMYTLEKLDTEPSTATLGQRLCGIIKKEIRVDANIKAPMRWLSYQQGVKLIEIIKKIIANAERRRDGGRTEN